jgi:hypothetical protein
MKPDNQRILPALLKSVEFAQKNGWMTEADLAGEAMMFTYAGLMDNADPNDPMIVKWGSELSRLLDKYGLSVFGRDDKPSVQEDVTPIDTIKANRVSNTENIDHTNNKPN